MEDTQTQVLTFIEKKVGYRKTYYLETYRCQMNVADSKMIEGILKVKKYSSIDSMDKTDIIFVNTCAIREHAEEKVCILV